MIKNICFINNYNNEVFIRECLESVYSQTQPFDEVLVVDDGSTDSSVKIIEEIAVKYPNLRLLQKKNDGQTSTFNFVLSLIPKNAQIFLLDGDDIYPRDYLELVINLLGKQGWDFAFCEQQKFYGDESLKISTANINNESCHFFSKTSALTRSRGCWIGSPTSCISISARLFRRIFPYPYYRDQIFWVDDLLIYASSVLGAKKIYIPSIAIGWRSHGKNNSKKFYSSEDVQCRKIAIDRFFFWCCSENGIPRYPGIIEFFEEYEQLGIYWQRRLDLPSRYRIFSRLFRGLIKQTLTHKTK